MKRKEFFKKTLQMGCLASTHMLLFDGSKSVAQSNKDKDSHELAMQQEFKEQWIATLMENLEDQVDEEIRYSLMVSCGRACARRGATRLAEACKGDVNKLLAVLAKSPDIETRYLGGDTIHLSYKKCLCELVGHGPDRLPETYCMCSEGWVLEMFETVAQKSVQVEKIQTIKQGASSCKFAIHL